MKTRLFALMQLLFLAFVFSALQATPVSAAEEKEYIINFKTASSAPITLVSPAEISAARTALQPVLAGVQAETLYNYDNIPAVAVTVDEAKVAQLLSDPMVESIEENKNVTISLREAGDLIGADTLHNRGHGGANSSVVVIDSGTKLDHPFYQVIDGGCFSNVAADANLVSQCPNGQNTQKGVAAAEPCKVQVAGCDHGTHVAGIVGGGATNIRGIAPETAIIGINAFSQSNSAASCIGTTPPCQTGKSSDIIASLDYVLELIGKYKNSSTPVASVNLSLGAAFFESEAQCKAASGVSYEIFKAINDMGVSIVAASGNEAKNNGSGWPACLDNVINVGATDDNNAVAKFSNESGFVDVYAPGVKVVSAANEQYRIFRHSDGTSMATPVVSGAIAILKGENPSLTPAQIEQTLKSTGTAVTGRRGGGLATRINVEAAFNSLIGGSNGAAITTNKQGVTQCRTSHMTDNRATTAIALPEYNGTTQSYMMFVRIRSATDITGQIVADAYRKGEGFGFNSLCGALAIDVDASNPQVKVSANEWRWVPVVSPDLLNNGTSASETANEVTVYFAPGIEVDSLIIRSIDCDNKDAGGVCDETFTRNLFAEAIDAERFVEDTSANNGAFTQFGPALNSATKSVQIEQAVLGAFSDDVASLQPARTVYQSAISLPVLSLTIAAVVGGLAVVFVVVRHTVLGKKLAMQHIVMVVSFGIVGIVALAVTQAGTPPVQKYEFEQFQQLPSTATNKIDPTANGGATVQFN